MIYSPSSREEFSFCPRSWWLRKKGLVPRTIEYPELCAIGGNVVGKAMETWNIDRMKGLNITLGHLLSEGEAQISNSLYEVEKYRTLSGVKAHQFYTELPSLVTKAISLLWNEDPLKPYAILSAEESFPHAGNSRLDVRVKQADGREIVFDYKVKFGPTEEKYYLKSMEDHARGEQRLTYTHLTGTDMFGIIMVCLQPLQNRTRKPLKPYVYVNTWPVQDQEKEIWLRDALLMTPEMDAVLKIDSPEKVRGRTFPHANQFGECKYSDACLRYALDPERMALDYVYIK